LGAKPTLCFPLEQADQWNTIGVARELDDVLEGLRSDYPVGLDVEATPRRREFCKNKGLVQRYVLNATCSLLPVTNVKLAASVGATVRELTAEPIDPRAVDVVFDALAESQSGIEDEGTLNARRATFERADGSFNREAFAAALGAARAKVALSLCVWPGLPNVLFLFLALKLDAFSSAAESASDVLAVVQSNWQTNGPASLLLPALPLAVLAWGAANPPKSSKAATEAAAADRLFMQTRVKTRLRTKAETPTSTPSS
jgi:hypothetical protein